MTLTVDEARKNLAKAERDAMFAVDDAKRELEIALFNAERAELPEWMPLLASHNINPDYDQRLRMAASLEAVRRGVCAYRSVGNQMCDCKYGAGEYVAGTASQPPRPGSEVTGCPELRDAILLLLKR